MHKITEGIIGMVTAFYLGNCNYQAHEIEKDYSSLDEARAQFISARTPEQKIKYEERIDLLRHEIDLKIDLIDILKPRQLSNGD